MYYSIFRIILMIHIFLGTALAEAQAFEMFGIDILTATRSQITNAILQRGAQKLPSTDHLTDRYDANPIAPGARMLVGFTTHEKLESIIYRFDSGNLYTDVLKYDRLKLSLIEKYGKPTVSPSVERNSDFEEELLWTNEGIQIQLVNFKWHAAWRIHVTHRLVYYFK